MATADSHDNLSPLSAGRIPSLDGLRAVAVSLVIAGHLSAGGPFPGREFILSHGGNIILDQAGGWGVRIFFVISGFLITYLLLSERASTGRISLKNFYLRRVLRIFPAAYAYIAFIGLLGLLGVVHFSRTDFLAACTYTINCFPPGSLCLGHLWSLAVEEQFYLLWPLALCLFGKKMNGVYVAAFFFLIGPCARYVYLNWEPGRESEWDAIRSFAYNSDALACGCLLAGLRETLGQSKLYRTLRRSWLFLVVLFLVGAHRGLGLRLESSLSLDWALINISIALGIDWCVSNYDSLIGRVLNWRPLAFVGALSYSLYLWQELFLMNKDFRAAIPFPLNLLLIFVLAFLSFFCIERQFLKLRKHFSSKPLAAGLAPTPGPLPGAAPAVDTPPAAPL